MLVWSLLFVVCVQDPLPPPALNAGVVAWVEAKLDLDLSGQALALVQVEQAVEQWRAIGEARPLQRDETWSQILRQALRDTSSGRSAPGASAPVGFRGIPEGDGPHPLVLVLHSPQDGDLSYLPASFAVVGVTWPSVQSENSGELVAEALTAMARTGRLDRNRIVLLGVGKIASLAAQDAFLKVPGRYAAVAFTPLETRKLEPFQQEGWKNLTPAPAFGFFSSPEIAAEFLLTVKPRRPFPRQLSLVLSQPEAAAPGWWVQPVRFDPGSPGGMAARLSVTADSIANSIRIQAHHVDEVRLFLNDQLVDLDRPIQLTRNGVSTRFFAVRNVRTLLERWATDLDDRALMPAQILAVDLPSLNP